MRIEFFGTPWYQGDPPRLATEASELLDGAWRTAATEYVGVRRVRLSQGRREPKGLQSFLNREIESRLCAGGWEGEGGRYRRDGVWLRVTFRHQMSLGSDFLDALRVCRLEDIDTAIICAAPLDLLKVISPNDAGALSSFEKVRITASSLSGVLDFPLLVGRLVPRSGVSPDVFDALRSPRPRN